MSEKCLVMYSGGRLSIISALKAISEGFDIYPVTFSMGHIHAFSKYLSETSYSTLIASSNLDYITQTRKIVNVDLIQHVMMLKFRVAGHTLADIGNTGAIIPFTVLPCMLCFTTMIISGILECKENKIEHLFMGLSKASSVFAGEEFYSFAQKLCKKYNIIFHTLMNDDDLQCNWDIKQSLVLSGLIPKVTEQYCTYGECSESKSFEHSSYITRFPENTGDFYDKIVFNVACDIIDRHPYKYGIIRDYSFRDRI